ncbi:MAG: 23S rRNA (adenine(2503)-C(2))-methyltransferase RlmN [Armatimonadetes bacterium]|nr:23S rRNA (adenine(2503)-C(2))-methyltransferase RlmN [Armatimonadota bacterium]
MGTRDLYGMTREELSASFTERGQPRFRADQVFRWVHANLARSFDEMTDLPAALRQELAEELSVGPLQPVTVSEAPDSTKLLLALADGQTVECVRMTTGPETASVCVSSQVGCAIRCTFCASGCGGLVRNLSAGEIVVQAVTLRALVGPARNVVFMGMGEPLHNLDAVLKAIALLTDKAGWGLSPQRITVATSGVAWGIRRLAAEGPAVELALSLNAPTDDLRRELMPGVRDLLTEVLAACDEFSARHGGQPVTFAYVLLRGVNDQPGHAAELARLLAGRRHHLNLIPYNAVEGLPFERPAKHEAEAFRGRLERAGLNVTLRRSRGQSINAACGQLRARAG